ncbi:MAG: branched-chain amino acid transport system permease protein, partial [Actinomycetota bacterium]
MLLLLAFVNGSFFKPAFFLQLVTNGLSNGAIYAAMALTVVIIYKTTGHLNFAQGEMATFAAFVVYVLTAEQHFNIWIALPVVVVLSMAAGAGLERFLIRPVESRSNLAVVIVTLGLFLLLNALTAVIWGTQPKTGLRPFPGGIHDQITVLKGPPQFAIGYGAIGTWAVLIGVVVAVSVLLNKTKLGLGYRAVAANRESAQLVGIPVSRMLMLGWALSTGIGSIGGVLVSQSSGTLDFNLMGSVLIYGFAAAALGGFDSIRGAIVGGLIVGLAEALLPNLFTFVGSELSLAMALVIILAVLLV